MLAAPLLLAACATGETTSRGLSPGQWTPAQKVGADRYLIQGHSTQDAINGGDANCKNMGKQFDAITVHPHDRDTRATVIYTCR